MPTPADMPTPAETIGIALQHHREGRVAEAEQAYRQILQQQPDFIDALNLLGALIYQQGRYEEASVCFDRVLTLQPDSPDSYNSMGVVLKGQGKLQEAVDYYRKALALKPDLPEVHNNLGNVLKDLGHLDTSLDHYQQAIALKPSYADAHNNLGVVLKDLGRYEEAMAHYRQALLHKPNYPEAQHNLGVVLQRQGQFERAIAAYQQALEGKPNYPEVFNSWGNALQQQGKPEEAIPKHQQAIALKPDYPEAYHCLGNALQQQGESEAAIAQYERALQLRPAYPEVLNNFGNALQDLGRVEEAIARYQQALELRPNFAEAHSNLGALLKDQRKLEEAIAHFRQALALRPDYAEVHNNLGNAYQEQGDLEAAIACYREALTLKPLPETHSNLGNMLQQLGQFEEAFTHFEQALALQPNFAGAYNNWGIALRNSGEVEASLAVYERAIELDPAFVEAHWNKALTHLCQGDLQAGFAGYEWRFQWSHFQQQNPPRLYSQPRWDGSDPQGKTLFLYAEQGMGDTIQFIRYAILAAQRGARVIVECQAPLLSLLQAIPELQQCIPQGAPLPPFDLHAPLMSLPHLFGTTLETVPTPVPYLTLPSRSSISQLRDPEDHSPGFHIGLVWEGNPHNPYNRTRTCPLQQLLSLADLAGVQLYSLQKDLNSGDLAQLQAHPEVVDLRESLTDFVATGHLIQQLDLVITVDTAVAHLAGALGKPVWLLLPLAADWRWLLEREDSPWYPSMRLFRQTAYGDWDPVIAQVRAALAQTADRPGVPEQKTKQRKRLNLAAHLSLSNGHSPAASGSNPVLTLPPVPAELRQAIALYKAGKPREAEQLCHQVLQQQPHPEVWNLLGLIAHGERRLDDAIAAYRQVIVLNPDHCETYNNLAVALHEQGRFDEAITHYEKALALNPDYADAHNNFANALREKGRVEEAIRHYRTAIAIKPDYADAYNNLGLILFAERRYEEAAEAYQQAVAFRPSYAQAHNHLGNALKELGDFDQAEVHYQQAIALKPDYAKAYNNWGNVFRDRGDLPTALRYYDQATTIEPNFAEAHWNKALTQLLAGDLKGGFAEYEWRWRVKLPSFLPMRPFACPQWDGSDLQGKTIFLHAEQGMGDIIQFVRYAPLVAQRGARVIVECQPPLVKLFQSIPGIQRVIAYGEALPAFDLHAPLMSLPHLFGTTLETVPNQVPYLPLQELPEPVLLPKLEDGGDRLRVGMVWTGNPQNPYNRTRTCPLEQVLSLSDFPGIQLYSLQKDLNPSDQAQLQAHPEVVNLCDRLTDFVATAHLIQQLDLVIAIDTAVAHLAGALGKPVWLLLPFAPDWRWLLERQDSPWYPTMRLFRQSTYGDWNPVITQVRAALLQTCGKSEPGTKREKRKKRQQSKSVTLNPRPAIAPLPPSPPPSMTLVLQHYQNGNVVEAERICRQLLQQQPQQVEALHALGVLLCHGRQFDLAIAQFQQALQLQPDFVDAWGNLANALQEQGKGEAAIAAYERALTLKPDYGDACHNLAVLLQDQDRLEEALEHSQQVVVLKPDFASGHYNLGFVLRRLGQVEGAIASYRRAIQLQPDLVAAHKNLGHALLLSGDFANGFAEYEWRWRQPDWVARPFSQPLWDGSPLAGKTILLHAEQGLGDTIQFIRYAQQVRDRGGRVIVECQAPLRRLLETAPGMDQLVVQGAALPAFDVHAPLLSLPHLLETTLETIPAPGAYLRPPAASWVLPLPSGPAPQLKVGIVWCGNPDYKYNRYRSCEVEQFRSLQLPGVALYSLQKGTAAADLQRCSDLHPDLPILDLSEQLQDFADTAAAIAQLDLVITVDTAVAHLAGALGKPVWVLLAFAPDWRWLLEREDSPWYPSMRLFRQAQRGDWTEVFDRVKTALQQQLTPPAQPTRRAELRQQLGAIGQQLTAISDHLAVLTNQLAAIQAELGDD